MRGRLRGEGKGEEMLETRAKVLQGKSQGVWAREPWRYSDCENHQAPGVSVAGGATRVIAPLKRQNLQRRRKQQRGEPGLSRAV